MCIAMAAKLKLLLGVVCFALNYLHTLAKCVNKTRLIPGSCEYVPLITFIVVAISARLPVSTVVSCQPRRPCAASFHLAWCCDSCVRGKILLGAIVQHRCGHAHLHVLSPSTHVFIN